jgi:hypothetical protein
VAGGRPFDSKRPPLPVAGGNMGVPGGEDGGETPEAAE